ncbi:homoserine O-acetyltransferase [Nanchangia anserum]|uniref:Homoserine O-acetyltransferase n=1 Tax=Nanchangia anserum TaxID=2692125 RepID=A0A8I0GFD0_9ACTO|nr:homoserine O-acetyltransferase [Nanchangia anserum]MBD3689817.1 homoserine O-acetyltransferase [Nanchangia anserum]QOX81986.1 homoserine O-acetyltransferase [Nanchangia anserum]
MLLTHPSPTPSLDTENTLASGLRHAAIGPLRTESGRVLPATRLAYETWGRLNAERSNAVLILHALTGDSHVIGEATGPHPTSGWWEGMVGPGAPIDTNRFFVVAPNVLGGCQGSTGPASPAPDGKPWGSRFPQLSVRDMVSAEVRLADYLGIDRFALVIGPSAGGHRALEWACGYPERLEQLVLIATSPDTSADQAAWASLQLHALELDPAFRDGDYYGKPDQPTRGLGLARQIAHATYRSAEELNTRFGRIAQGSEDPLRGGRLAVQSYLDYHGDKLTARFDAGTYRVLTRAMLTHDVGRERGGVAAALDLIEAHTLVLAVDSDRLFPAHSCRWLARHIPRACYGEIASLAGHDGFLIERDQVADHLTHFLSLQSD